MRDIGVGINNREGRDTIKRINKTKYQFFKKSNKINKNVLRTTSSKKPTLQPEIYEHVYDRGGIDQWRKKKQFRIC